MDLKLVTALIALQKLAQDPRSIPRPMAARSQADMPSRLPSSRPDVLPGGTGVRRHTGDSASWTPSARTKPRSLGEIVALFGQRQEVASLTEYSTHAPPLLKEQTTFVRAHALDEHPLGDGASATSARSAMVPCRPAHLNRAGLQGLVDDVTGHQVGAMFMAAFSRSYAFHGMVASRSCAQPDPSAPQSRLSIPGLWSARTRRRRGGGFHRNGNRN